MTGDAVVALPILACLLPCRTSLSVHTSILPLFSGTYKQRENVREQTTKTKPVDETVIEVTYENFDEMFCFDLGLLQIPHNLVGSSTIQYVAPCAMNNAGTDRRTFRCALSFPCAIVCRVLVDCTSHDLITDEFIISDTPYAGDNVMMCGRVKCKNRTRIKKHPVNTFATEVGIHWPQSG
ncbi:hypothetical protein CBL_05553 [Carabus blaptoides fortunei]